MGAPCRYQLPPRELRGAPALGLLGAAERIENVELERRTRKPALLELARHRDEPFGGARDVLARNCPPPRVRASPSIAEDPARDHEPGFPLGAQLRKGSEVLVVEEPVRHIQFGLHVRLRTLGADRGRIRARAEEQPDRLREDRLPRSRLARHGVQAGHERQVRAADEDEILDPKATKHGVRSARVRQRLPRRRKCRGSCLLLAESRCQESSARHATEAVI